MINAGIIGFGGMGHLHFGVYEKSSNVKLVAIADIDEQKLEMGDNTQNINIGEGDATIDPELHTIYSDPTQLIEDDSIDLVDVCLPTYLHADYAIQALEAGKHVLCEKPMALTSRECERMLDAADNAPGHLMIAQCIRFWPEYEYLKETVDSGRLGEVRCVDLWRGGATPDWSWDGWLTDANRSGGAVLDLHVHDVDFVQDLLGQPDSVFATGALGCSGGYDMIDTLYNYNDDISVHTGCAWELPPSVGFEMTYNVAFEEGTIVFSTKHSPTLAEYVDDEPLHPEVDDEGGYHREIEYFIQCIQNDEPPHRCTPESAASSVRIARAEEESARTGDVVKL